MADVTVELTVNGRLRRATVEPRLTLADFLRERLQLIGTHLVQAAFREHHGLQCGFCTPGFITSVTAFLRDNPDPTDEQVRDTLSGNLCRCTGYQGILNAVRTVTGTVSDTAVPTDATNQETR